MLAQDGCMATTITLDTLRELAAFRAERGCAISLFLNLDPTDAPTALDVATRVSSLLKDAQRHLPADLDHERREGVRADLERLERFLRSELDRDGASGYAVFADGLDEAWHTLPLIAPVADTARVGSEFHLAPLVPLLGRGEGALVVAVGRERGSLYRLQGGRLIQLADLSEEAPRRHDQGGWSQSRFQRGIDRLAHDHYRVIAEELARDFRTLGRPRIVGIASDDARAEFDAVLDADVAEAIVGWAQAEAHAGPARLEAAVAPLLERWQTEREIEVVERWREEIGRGARGTAGWEDTLEAASDARVELLLYREGANREAVCCPRCGRVQAVAANCPLDGEPMERRPDGLELAVRQTLAHGGALWAVVHRQDLEPVGGVGAILRF
jgi:peptide chain release factor subunit 1